jgi:hypothetical protein
MQFNDLDKFLGKYVSITDEKCNGAAGWVIKVSKTYVHKSLGLVRLIEFDYGMGYFVTMNSSIEEVEPPPNDPGPYIPDNDPPTSP